MNDLIERYMQAIGFWLPQREDVVAEIAEDLHSQIADEEERLGRPLMMGEIEALVQRRGRPMLVANGYRPQRSLIGPVWFPIYLLVLKAGMVCGVLPWIMVWLIVFRVQHPDMPWVDSLLAAGSTLFSLTFLTAGVVTLLFVVLQWVEARAHFLERWNPRELPPVRDPDKISLSFAVMELMANIVFLLLWLIYARSPIIFDGPAFKLGLTSTWTAFFWGLLVVALCNAALAVVHLRSRSWTRLRAAARMLFDLASGALFGCLMKAHVVATLYSAGLGSDRSLALKDAINLWMDRCFPLAVAAAAIVLTVDAARLVRVVKTRGVKSPQAFA